MQILFKNFKAFEKSLSAGGKVTVQNQKQFTLRLLNNPETALKYL